MKTQDGKILKYCKQACPKCGEHKVKKYFYGEPAMAVLPPKYKDGGCCIDTESPKWHCNACQHEWGKVNLDEE